MNDGYGEIVIEDTYYLVKWRIRKREFICYGMQFLLFNIICYVFIYTNHASDTAFLFFTMLFANIISVILLYLGIKIPYVRWKKAEKPKGEYKDITLIQNKYRAVVMKIYSMLLILAVLIVIYMAVFVKLIE